MVSASIQGAIEALDVALTEHPDGGEVISIVLASVAARHGGTAWLTRGRAGSWEAHYVQGFMASTVGYADEHLSAYADTQEP